MFLARRFKNLISIPIALSVSFALILSTSPFLGAVSAEEPWNGTGAYMTRVSTNANGEEGNGYSSQNTSVSDDGRYVAFASGASNLVPGDNNGNLDVFRKDLKTGEVVRVSTGSQGEEIGWGADCSISADGRYVAFQRGGVFRKDLQTGQLVEASTNAKGEAANGWCQTGYLSFISADGRYVSFASWATNLVPGVNNGQQIYRKDLQTGEVVLVSTNAQGEAADAPCYGHDHSISSDGRYLAFGSAASNLVPGANAGFYEIYRKDLQTGEVVKVSTSESGEEANERCWRPNIGANGRYVAFASGASNLVPGDNNGMLDNFRKDLETGEIVRVSISESGEEQNGHSTPWNAMSDDGCYVAFASYASSLVPGDNYGLHIYRKELQTGDIVRVSINAQGEVANNWSQRLSMSADGRFIAFNSGASNLVAGDTNRCGDAFLADMSLHPEVKVTIDSLITAKERCYSLGWITSSSTVHSLDVKLNAAKAAISRGQNNAAKNILGAFKNEVQAKSGKTINAQATSLLINMADKLIAKL